MTSGQDNWMPAAPSSRRRLPWLYCCRSMKIFSIDERRIGATCATSLRSRVYRRSRSTRTSEVASCTFDEQRRVLEISKEELGELPIVNAPTAASRLRASRGWRKPAARRRCSSPSAISSRAAPEVGARAFQAHRRRAGLPLIAFQYPSPTARATRFPADEDLDGGARPSAIKVGAQVRSSTSGRCACCNRVRRRSASLTTHCPGSAELLVLGAAGCFRERRGSVMRSCRAASP